MILFITKKADQPNVENKRPYRVGITLDNVTIFAEAVAISIAFSTLASVIPTHWITSEPTPPIKPPEVTP